MSHADKLALAWSLSILTAPEVVAFWGLVVGALLLRPGRGRT